MWVPLAFFKTWYYNLMVIHLFYLLRNHGMSSLQPGLRIRVGVTRIQPSSKNRNWLSRKNTEPDPTLNFWHESRVKRSVPMKFHNWVESKIFAMLTAKWIRKKYRYRWILDPESRIKSRFRSDFFSCNNLCKFKNKKNE